MTALFLGGPLDGQIKAISDQTLAIKAHHYHSPADIETIRYSRSLPLHSKQFAILYPETMKQDEALAILFGKIGSKILQANLDIMRDFATEVK